MDPEPASGVDPMVWVGTSMSQVRERMVRERQQLVLGHFQSVRVCPSSRSEENMSNKHLHIHPHDIKGTKRFWWYDDIKGITVVMQADFHGGTTVFTPGAAGSA